jgi:hypothetical protein
MLSLKIYNHDYSSEFMNKNRCRHCIYSSAIIFPKTLPKSSICDDGLHKLTEFYQNYYSRFLENGHFVFWGAHLTGPYFGARMSIFTGYRPTKDKFLNTK